MVLIQYFGNLSILVLILLIGIINEVLADSALDKLSGFKKRKASKKRPQKVVTKRRKPHGYIERLRRYKKLFTKKGSEEKKRTAICCFLVLWAINLVWLIAAVTLWLVYLFFSNLSWIPPFVSYISIGIFLLICLLSDIFPSNEVEKEHAKANRSSFVLRLVLIVAFIVYKLKSL